MQMSERTSAADDWEAAGCIIWTVGGLGALENKTKSENDQCCHLFHENIMTPNDITGIRTT